jgi:hypothetical protein
MGHFRFWFHGLVWSVVRKMAGPPGMAGRAKTSGQFGSDASGKQGVRQSAPHLILFYE